MVVEIISSVCLLSCIITVNSLSILRPEAFNKPKPFSGLEVDVAVVGGGIAGTAISCLLQDQHKCKVALIDPRVNSVSSWYPNYGEWRDEWHFLSQRLKYPELKTCTTTEWESTDCYFGGSHGIPVDQKTKLPRPYVRVDRVKMQKLLRDKFSNAGGAAVAGKIDTNRIGNNLFDRGINHDVNGTVLTLDDGTQIRAKVVVDSSGLESRLVARESANVARGINQEIPVGYQIAYGFIAHVSNLGPYDEKAMTLFDYRTNYLEDNAAMLTEGLRKPTFMYAMPLGREEDGSYRVFFEETSLVGRGDRRLTFEECKQRAFKRLEFHNVEVLGVEEEEYCYIPMGGELPDLTQRIVAFGGAANMVHPSTGYHACRMLAAATDVASVIGKGVQGNLTPDHIALLAYKSMWTKQNRLQRDFQAFGGDFLMQQPVSILRGFFQAFFQVKQPVWSGFLAGWPGLPNNEYHDSWEKRLAFATSLFTHMPNPVRLAMMAFAVQYTVRYGPNTLVRSLVPFFGDGPGEPVWEKPGGVYKLGDETAKEEARRMMKAFVPTVRQGGVKITDLPAPFN